MTIPRPRLDSHRRTAVLFSLLLALVLFGAQWVGLAHELDLHAHTGDEVCALCLLWHSSDALVAVPARHIPPLPAAAGASPDIVQTPIATPYATRFPRGPPSILS